MKPVDCTSPNNLFEAVTKNGISSNDLRNVVKNRSPTSSGLTLHSSSLPIRLRNDCGATPVDNSTLSSLLRCAAGIDFAFFRRLAVHWRRQERQSFHADTGVCRKKRLHLA
ncbi:hypothetical protein SprV_0301354100 [Sparganum proliferum]